MSLDMNTLFDDLYVFLDGVLNPTGGPNPEVTVHLAFQNTPVPSTPRLAIGEPILKQDGQPQRTYDKTSKEEIIKTEYKGYFQMWAVTSRDPEYTGERPNDIIRRINSAFGLAQWVEYLNSKGISIITVEGPTSSPRLEEEKYDQESVGIIHLTVADEVRGTINAIEKTTVTPTIE